MEHKAPVEHHDDHAGKGEQRTAQLHHADARSGTVDQPHQQRGKERTRAHDERGIGGRGKVHRLVFAEEVERTAADAEQHHLEFVAPRVGPQP